MSASPISVSSFTINSGEEHEVRAKQDHPLLPRDNDGRYHLWRWNFYVDSRWSGETAVSFRGNFDEARIFAERLSDIVKDADAAIEVAADNLHQRMKSLKREVDQ